MPSRDDQKLEIQQATDVVRLIGEHVALKARGKEFLGLCPFHDDKNPSLNVSPTKQIYKCFSCGAGGDVFSFVQNYHKMSFPEALRFLAERAGIKLIARSQSDEPDSGPTDRQRILDANVRAASFYRALFRHAEHGRSARDYVQKRSISPDMIEAFQIGYAADLWDGLVTMIRDKGWDQSSFDLAGLVSARNNGPGHYDRLRHRLIFPICDSIGRIIAFGGRKLRDEDEPKYLNSPETVVFNKSATLFGLHLAKKAIGDSKMAVIVEGYTDVIACHQAGVRNVVATLGTALTAQHVSELRRYCEKVVLVYDGDAAGIKATDRAIEIFLTGDLDVALAVLPDEMDPAEVFEQPDGLDRWNQAVAAATPALEYQFHRLKDQFAGAGTVTGRQHLIESYLQQLGQLGLARMSPLRRAMVVQQLCGLLHISEQTIQEMLRRALPSPSRSGNPRQAYQTAPQSVSNSENQALIQGNNPDGDVAQSQNGNRIKAVVQAQRLIIGCLLRDASLFHLALADGRSFDEAIVPGEFISDDARSLYERIYQRLADPKAPGLTLAWLLAELASDHRQDLANLATLAESEAEQASQGGPELIAQLLGSAAQCVMKHHQEEQYQQARRNLVEGSGDSEMSQASDVHQDPEAQLVRQADQLREYCRANPSPLRIARMPA